MMSILKYLGPCYKVLSTTFKLYPSFLSKYISLSDSVFLPVKKVNTSDCLQYGYIKSLP